MSIEPGSPASQAGIEINFTHYLFSLTRCLSTWEWWRFFLGKCARTAAKTMVGNRKKPEKTLALLYLASGPLRNAVNSSVADRVRSRTDNKDEVLEGKFVTWNFCLPPKRQLSILLNFFFPLIKLFLTFVVKTRVTIHAISRQNAGYSTWLSQVMPPHIGDSVV